MADKTLTCSDCGMEFAFTEREQEFYTEKGFSEPRRCPSCRASRKAARAGDRVVMAAARTRAAAMTPAATAAAVAIPPAATAGGGGYGQRSSGPREMFSATCSSCGKEAKVPFRPTNGKPVYCSDCFRTQRGG